VEITTLAVVVIAAVAADRPLPAVPAFGLAAAAVKVATVLDARRLSQVLEPGQFVWAPSAPRWRSTSGVLRRHRAALTELATRNIELEQLRVADARRAVIEDRARIARDLYDVVAHHVSAMAVRANAGRHVAHQQQDQAVAALDYVAGDASETLTALRRMVGLLRADPEPATPTPTPDLHATDPGRRSALVAQVNGAGGRVVLNGRGDPQHLAADVQVTVYRVVQEGLTNAVRHAAGPRVEVDLHGHPGQLRASVTNGPPAAAASAEPVPGLGAGGGHVCSACETAGPVRRAAGRRPHRSGSRCRADRRRR